MIKMIQFLWMLMSRHRWHSDISFRPILLTVSHLLAKCLAKPLLSRSSRSSPLVSVRGFVSVPASLGSIFIRFMMVFLSQVWLWQNWTTLKRNCQVIDGVVKSDWRRRLVSARPVKFFELAYWLLYSPDQALEKLQWLLSLGSKEQLLNCKCICLHRVFKEWN